MGSLKRRRCQRTATVQAEDWTAAEKLLNERPTMGDLTADHGTVLGLAAVQ